MPDVTINFESSRRIDIRRAYKKTSRHPQPEEMRSNFTGLGLLGDFWDPQSDSFG
jgi:hypothetical protein